MAAVEAATGLKLNYGANSSKQSINQLVTCHVPDRPTMSYQHLYLLQSQQLAR